VLDASEEPTTPTKDQVSSSLCLYFYCHSSCAKAQGSNSNTSGRLGGNFSVKVERSMKIGTKKKGGRGGEGGGEGHAKQILEKQQQ